MDIMTPMLDRWREASSRIDAMPPSDPAVPHLSEIRDKLAHSTVSVGRGNPLLDLKSPEVELLAADATRYAALFRDGGRPRFTDSPRRDDRERVEARLREVGIPIERVARERVPANDRAVTDDQRQLAAMAAVVAGNFRQLPEPMRSRTVALAVTAGQRIERGDMPSTGSGALDKELWVDARRVPGAIQIFEESRKPAVAAPVRAAGLRT